MIFYSIAYSQLLTAERFDMRCGLTADYAVCKKNTCCSAKGWCGDSDEHCKTECHYQCDGMPGALNAEVELNIRSDNRCGPDVDNAICIPGQCCSVFGFCGDSSLHCLTQCAFQCKITPSIEAECVQVIKLAKTLNMHITNRALYNRLDINCCNTNVGIICKDKRIVGIDWRSMNLNGTLKTEYIPSSLESLVLYQNRIQSTIPYGLPNSLTYLQINVNNFTGGIPTLPPNIKQLIADSNNLNGTISSLPESLTHFIINTKNSDFNRLTGVVKLNKPEIIYLYNAGINFFEVKDPNAIVDCDISKNALKSQNLKSLRKCRQTDLY